MTATASPQETVGIIGVVSQHVSWGAAATVATHYSEMNEVTTTFFADHATPVYINQVNRAPGGVICRDVGQGGLAPVTSLTTDELREVSREGLRAAGSFVINNTNGAAPTSVFNGFDYTNVIPSAAETWTTRRIQLSDGVPKTLKLRGRPQVIIDRITDGQYIVYAVFGHATFEALVPSQTDFAPSRGVLGFLRTVLGLVESVVHATRTLIDELETRSFMTMAKPDGTISIPRQDSTLPSLCDLLTEVEFHAFKVKFAAWRRGQKTSQNKKAISYPSGGKITKAKPKQKKVARPANAKGKPKRS